MPSSSMVDVDFILGECNRVTKEPLDYSHVKAAWAGLRPLVKDPNADPEDTKKARAAHTSRARAFARHARWTSAPTLHCWL